MKINWFEGGRRITKLFMAIVALIGAYNAYFEYQRPALEFSTSSPLLPWEVNLPSADAAVWEKAPLACGRSENISDFEIKSGLVRNVSLCFLPGEQGSIVSYFVDEDDKDLKHLRKIEAAFDRAKAMGEFGDARVLALEAARKRIIIDHAQQTRLQTLTENGFYLAQSEYVNQRVAEFQIDPDTVAAIEKELPRVEREAFLDHVTEVLSITAYFIGGFWIFSFVIGWIVRGFAGIPRGQDFRSKPIKAAD
jgi:hypothetical protein